MIPETTETDCSKLKMLWSLIVLLCLSLGSSAILKSGIRGGRSREYAALGETVTIKCTVSPDLPANHTILWTYVLSHVSVVIYSSLSGFANVENITTDGRFSIVPNTKFDLRITGVTKIDFATFVCHDQDGTLLTSHLSQMHEHSITLSDNRNDGYVGLNKTGGSVSCQSSGGIPPSLTLQWFLDGIEISKTSSKPKRMSHLTRGRGVFETLTWNGVDTSLNGSRVLCRITQTFESWTYSTNESVDIMVYYFDTTISPSTTNTFEGQKLGPIICIAQGNPSDFKFNWQQTGEYLEHPRSFSQDAVETANGQSLTLNLAQYYDNGNITCSVTTSRQLVKEISSLSTVKFAARRAPLWQATRWADSLRANLGDTHQQFQLQFIANPVPNARDVTWKRPNGKPIPAHADVNTNGTLATLMFGPLKQEDFGNYVLEVANGIGLPTKFSCFIFPLDENTTKSNAAVTTGGGGADAFVLSISVLVGVVCCSSRKSSFMILIPRV